MSELNDNNDKQYLNQQFSMVQSQKTHNLQEQQQKKKLSIESQQQQPTTEQKRQQNHQNNEFKLSPYLNEYLNNFKCNHNLPILQDYLQNFLSSNIQKYSIQKKYQLSIQQLSVSQNQKIILYQVKLLQFQFKLSVLNLNENDKFNLKHTNKINEGMFGAAYLLHFQGKDIVIKKIKFENVINRSKIIKNILKQYAIMKFCSALQTAPLMPQIFGFDLIINNDQIFFCMEKGVEVRDYIRICGSKKKFNLLFQNLKTSLLFLHSLNITHNDIKPENIVYSPTLEKFVFIDFGMSEINPQKLGQMKLQKSRGSYFYSCDNMKSLFQGTAQQAYIDMYFNDAFGINCSEKNFSMVNFQELKINEQMKELQDLVKQKSQLSSELILCEINQIEQIYSIYLIYLIYFEKLNQIDELIEQKQIQLVDLLNKHLNKIYMVFFQADYSISLFESYKKITKIFKKIKKDIQISFMTKQIIDVYLYPYFKSFNQYENHNNQQNQKVWRKYMQISNNNHIQYQKSSDSTSIEIKSSLRKKQIQKIKFQINLQVNEQPMQIAEKIVNFFIENQDQLFSCLFEVNNKVLIQIIQFQYPWFQFTDKIFQDCINFFQNIQVQLAFSSFQNRNFSNQDKTLFCLRILQKIYQLLIQKFNIWEFLGIILVQSFKNSFIQDTKKIIIRKIVTVYQYYMVHVRKSKDDNLSSTFKPSTIQKIQFFRKKDLKNYDIFQSCLSVFQSVHKILERRVSYEKIVQTTDSILNTLLIITINVSQCLEILNIKEQNTQIFVKQFRNLQLILFKCLNSWCKILFHSFLTSHKKFDLFRILSYFEKLYSLQTVLERKIDQIINCISLNQKHLITENILKVYKNVLIESKHIEFKIQQFHILLIQLILFPVKTLSDNNYFEKICSYVQQINKQITITYFKEFDLVKSTLVEKIGEITKRMKNYGIFENILKRIEVGQNMINSSKKCLDVLKTIYYMTNNQKRLKQTKQKIVYYLNKNFLNKQEKIQVHLQRLLFQNINKYNYTDSQYNIKSELESYKPEFKSCKSQCKSNESNESSVQKSKNNLQNNHAKSQQYSIQFTNQQSIQFNLKKKNIDFYDLNRYWKIVSLEKQYFCTDETKIENFFILLNCLLQSSYAYTEQTSYLLDLFNQELQKKQLIINQQLRLLKSFHSFKFFTTNLLKQSKQSQSFQQKFQSKLSQIKNDMILNIRKFTIYWIFFNYQQHPFQRLYNVQRQWRRFQDYLERKNYQKTIWMYSMKTSIMRILLYSEQNGKLWRQKRNNFIQSVIIFLNKFKNEYKNNLNEKNYNKIFDQEMVLKQYVRILYELYDKNIILQQKFLREFFNKSSQDYQLNLQHQIQSEFVILYLKMIRLQKQQKQFQNLTQYICIIKFVILYCCRQLLEINFQSNQQQWSQTIQINGEKVYCFTYFFYHYTKYMNGFPTTNHSQSLLLWSNYFKLQIQRKIATIFMNNQHVIQLFVGFVQKITKLQEQFIKVILGLDQDKFKQNKQIEQIEQVKQDKKSTKKYFPQIVLLITIVQRIKFLFFNIFLTNYVASQHQLPQINQKIIKSIQNVYRIIKIISQNIENQQKQLKVLLKYQIQAFLLIFRLLIQRFNQYQCFIKQHQKQLKRNSDFYYFKSFRSMVKKHIQLMQVRLSLFYKDKNFQQCNFTSLFHLQFRSPIRSLEYMQQKWIQSCKKYLKIKMSNKYHQKIHQNSLNIIQKKVRQKFKKYCEILEPHIKGLSQFEQRTFCQSTKKYVKL